MGSVEERTSQAIEEYGFDPLEWDVDYVRRRIASRGNRNTVRYLGKLEKWEG